MAAEEIVKLLTKTPLLEEIKRLPYHVLNVNIPNVDKTEDIAGRKMTRLGHSLLARPVHHMVDPRGRDTYWLSLKKSQHPQTEDYVDASIEMFNDASTDSLELASMNSLASQSITDKDDSLVVYTDDQAVAAGYISLSPVRLHHTPATSLDKFSSLVS